MLRLASSSPTRAKLLKEANIAFIQQSVAFDEEKIKAVSPKEFVYRATLGKYEANFSHFGIEDYPLLVADTVVATGNEIVRKPKDAAQAKEILLKQSGSITSIITCMFYHSKSKKLVDISATHYHFGKFDKEDLREYLASNLWRGKAGGCMVEGFCKKYIQKVSGFESTAMGLNTQVLSRFL